MQMMQSSCKTVHEYPLALKDLQVSAVLCKFSSQSLQVHNGREIVEYGLVGNNMTW